jgi:hypothetical protein
MPEPGSNLLLTPSFQTIRLFSLRKSISIVILGEP